MTKQELKRLYVATFGKIGPELIASTEAFHAAMMSIPDEPSARTDDEIDLESTMEYAETPVNGDK